MGQPWGVLGDPWGALGVLGGSLGILGGSLGVPGGSLGSPWGSLGGPWGVFWGPWGTLGGPWDPPSVFPGPCGATGGMGGVPDMVFRPDLGGDSVRYAPPLKRGAADLIASRIPPGQIGSLEAKYTSIWNTSIQYTSIQVYKYIGIQVYERLVA